MEHELPIEAQHVLNMLESEGWKLVKGKLDALILDLQNINNIDTSSPDTIFVDLKSRKTAADLLFAWLKRDVYGFVEQARAADTRLIEKNGSDYIDRG